MEINDNVYRKIDYDKIIIRNDSDSPSIIKKISEYPEQFKKINLNEPLFKGYDITQNCNPLSCRLIIFFTDILIPYFIQNIFEKTQETKVIANFTAIFNFIFYLIFDNYEINEKKWIVLQIIEILKVFDNEQTPVSTKKIDFVKKLCISLESQIVDNSVCNLKMIRDSPLNDISKINNHLYFELIQVLQNCVPFWSLIKNIYIKEELDNTIVLNPIIIDPQYIIIYPVKKDIGIKIFNYFADSSILKRLHQNSNERITLNYNICNDIRDYNIKKIKQLHLGLNTNAELKLAHLITRIIIGFYIFYILETLQLVKNDQNYPETFDELFTVFSPNDDMIVIPGYGVRIDILLQRFFFFLPLYEIKPKDEINKVQTVPLVEQLFKIAIQSSPLEESLKTSRENALQKKIYDEKEQEYRQLVGQIKLQKEQAEKEAEKINQAREAEKEEKLKKFKIQKKEEEKDYRIFKDLMWKHEKQKPYYNKRIKNIADEELEKRIWLSKLEPRWDNMTLTDIKAEYERQQAEYEKEKQDIQIIKDLMWKREQQTHNYKQMKFAIDNKRREILKQRYIIGEKTLNEYLKKYENLEEKYKKDWLNYWEPRWNNMTLNDIKEEYRRQSGNLLGGSHSDKKKSIKKRILKKPKKTIRNTKI